MSGSGDLLEILKQIPAIPGYVLTGAQLVRWLFRRYQSWKRAHRPPATTLIDHRVRMRQEIASNLGRTRRRGDDPLEPEDFEEIIVRDVKRLDMFPDLDSADVGVSPWLKLDVNDFYHRGIEVFLSHARKAVPIADEYGALGGWRFVDDDDKDGTAVHAVAVGRIPFDFIERVDWSRSDGYYNAPHFYCRFDGPLREPYEEIVYKERLYPPSRHYSELVGLRRDEDSWGLFRRRFFLLRQDLLRAWRRVRRPKTQ